eukprot:768581-Hanusia_phi.AAC.5
MDMNQTTLSQLTKSLHVTLISALFLLCALCAENPSQLLLECQGCCRFSRHCCCDSLAAHWSLEAARDEGAWQGDTSSSQHLPPCTLTARLQSGLSVSQILYQADNEGMNGGTSGVTASKGDASDFMNSADLGDYVDAIIGPSPSGLTDGGFKKRGSIAVSKIDASGFYYLNIQGEAGHALKTILQVQGIPVLLASLCTIFNLASFLSVSVFAHPLLVVKSFKAFSFLQSKLTCSSF